MAHQAMWSVESECQHIIRILKEVAPYSQFKRQETKTNTTNTELYKSRRRRKDLLESTANILSSDADNELSAGDVMMNRPPDPKSVGKQFAKDSGISYYLPITVILGTTIHPGMRILHEHKTKSWYFSL